MTSEYYESLAFMRTRLTMQHRRGRNHHGPVSALRHSVVMTAALPVGYSPDLPALERWMRGQGLLGDESVSMAATLLTGGRSNLTYCLTAGPNTYALRRPPLGDLMPTAHDMAREFRILSGLSRVEFPSATPVALCQDTDVLGAPFLLMRFVEGTVYASRDATARLSAARADRVSQSLIDTLTALHRVDLPAAGLADLGRPDGYLQRQLVRWAQQWELCKTRELPDVAALHRRIVDRLASVTHPSAAVMVHGDYRIDNVIFDPSSDQVAAVVDWEMSTIGDPVVDLAILLVYWTQPDDSLRSEVPVAPGITSGPGFWSRAEIIDAYQRIADIPADRLDVSCAFACYKLAVIMESIRQRVLAGAQLGSAADQASEMGAATVALTQMGHHVLDSGAVMGLAS